MKTPAHISTAPVVQVVDSIGSTSGRNDYSNKDLRFSVSLISRGLNTIFLVLLCLHLLTELAYQLNLPPAYTLFGKFYFDQETNFPSYFSSLLLIAVAVLLSIIAVVKHQRQDLFSKHWKWLSIIFLALGLDEAIGVHELLIDPVRAVLHTSGFMRFPWVILGVALTILIGLYYLRFLLSLSSDMKWRFVLAACLYVMGTIGMEMISGYFFIEFGTHNLSYEIAMTIEETLEMTSIMFFISTLLRYIKDNKYTISFQLK